MPTYEYEREDGSTFEVRQSMKDDPLTSCPDTGQKCHKIFSTPNVISYVGVAKTVIQQAEQNEKRLGAEKVEEIRATLRPPKKQRPKWLPSHIPEVDISKVKDIPHYVATGETNGPNS